MRAKNDKNTVKSTIIMNFTGSSDVLCLQQSFKEKLEFTSEFWVFPLCARSSTFLTACWLLIFMLSQPNRTILWVDGSGPQFQS